MLLWLNSYPADYKSAFAFSALPYPQPLRLLLRLAFPSALRRLPGELRAYHVPREYLCGLGLASPPVARHLRQVSQEYLNLTTRLLAPACQHLWLVITNDV